MSDTLPILGVAFASFCVWLAVRIFNRRERWAKWTLAGLLALSPIAFIIKGELEVREARKKATADLEMLEKKFLEFEQSKKRQAPGAL